MNTFKKILAVAFAAVMLVGAMALVGCNNSGASSAATDKLTLKIATNAEFEPFEYIVDGEYVGFDIDLINAIAAKLDAEVVINNMEFDAVLAALPTDNCNVGLSGLTINDTRKKSVDFTDTYYEVGQVLIVRKDDTVFTGTTKAELDAQLAGKTVGACSGYTGQFYIQGDADWGFEKIDGLTDKIYDNPSTAILDLKNGKIDAFILDDAVAIKAAAADANANDIKVINIPLTVELYAMAIKKGNTELQTKLNGALAALKSDGTIDNLLTKWELN